MDSLIQSLGKEGKVDLPLLQIVGDNIYQTVHSRDEKAITLKDVEALGHVEDILGDFLQEKLEELRDKMEMGKDILKSLLTSHATKKIASLEYITENVRLAGEGSNNTEVSTFLQKFERSRLIRRMEDGSYELTHDYLAKRINAWISEKDREVRKIEEMVDLAFRDFKERALYLDAERLRVSTPFKHTISMVKEQREFLSLSEKIIKRRKR